MPLPQQVEEAGRQADEMMKAVEAERQATDNTPPGAERPIPDEPITAPMGEETIESVKEQLRTAQHKYDVLKGKYDSEITAIRDDVNLLNRLKGENKAQKDQIRQLMAAQAELSSQVASLKQQADARPPAATVPTGSSSDLSKILSKEELEHLEQEDLAGKTLDIIQKLVRATAASAVPGNMEERLNQISSKVETAEKRAAEVAVSTWQEKLNTTIPDFERINADPKFIDWLNQPVSPYSRQTRGQALQQAMDAKDLNALKVGIDQFKADAGIRVNQPSQPQRSKLESQIEPGQSVSSNPSPTTAPGKKYSIGEVKQFYLDVAKGRWRGRETEQAAIDKDIVLAQQQGRIIP